MSPLSNYEQGQHGQACKKNPHPHEQNDAK